MALLVLAGVLTANQTSSVAQTASQLTEPVDASVPGEDAYISLTSLEGFSPEGGEAVFDPSSPYEETFSYAALDYANTRLVGLTRPSPLAHETGVVVAPAPGDEGPSSDVSTDSAAAQEEPEGAVGSEPATETENLDPVCEATISQTCDELAGPVIGDPCAKFSANPCEAAEQLIGDVDGDEPCEISSTVCEAVGDIETGDPCDPNNTEQTCPQYVAGLIEEIKDILGPVLGEPCDPDATGESCAAFVNNTYVNACTTTFDWQWACQDLEEQTECLEATVALAGCAEGIRSHAEGLTEQAVELPSPGGGGELVGTATDGSGQVFVRCYDNAFAFWQSGRGLKPVGFGGAMSCVGSSPPVVSATGFALLDKLFLFDPDNPRYVFHDFTLPYQCTPCNNDTKVTQKPHLALPGDQYQIRHQFALSAAPLYFWVGSHPGCFGYGTPYLQCEKKKVFTVTRDENLPN